MLLGLDLGTTNIKALLVEADGTVVASGSAPVKIDYLQGGGVEQDIEDIWQATLNAISKATAGLDGRQVESVGVCGQGGAMQVLDAQGEPAGRVVSWQDSRGAAWDRRLTAKLGSAWFARHIGFGSSGLTIGQLLRLREQNALPPGFRVGFVGDVIVGRLCGRSAHDMTSLSLAYLLNPSLAGEDPDVLEMIGLSRAQLPALLPATAPAAPLRPEVAEQTGLAPGTPVSPAVHDQYAADLGCGAARVGNVMLCAGTAWVLLATTDHLALPVAQGAFVCPHLVPGLYGQLLSLVNGGSSFSWALRTLGMGALSGAELDAVMQGVAPGCDGLRFTPLLAAGAPGLPPGAAGRMAGLHLAHTSAHILRAVVEGLACELGRILRLMTGGGIPVTRLVMSGNAAGSSVTPQIIADTVGLPVDCAAFAETSSLGAAMLARKLVEPDTAPAEIVSAMKPGTMHIEPGPGREAGARRLEEYLAPL